MNEITSYMEVWNLQTNTVDPTMIKGICADGTVVWIVNDPDSSYWMVYEAWLAQGNKPQPAPEAPAT